MKTKSPFSHKAQLAFPLAVLSLLVAGAISSVPAFAGQVTTDLIDQSIEDLMNIRVTSVSKTEQTLSRTAAAIFVITQDDIRHSGATNIPDLLRMVPGIYVAQIDANTWAFTSRGFNSRFSNKLLVMVDGRTAYTPTNGGVFWDVLDVPLEDIERIEVIRGPGGSIWGANAVDGVINLITKRASETHGSSITAGGGNVEPASGTLQYGGALRGNTDYRAFVKYLDYNSLRSPSGQSTPDGWHTLRGGFRVDHTFSPKDTGTIQGDIYAGSEGVTTNFGASPFAPNLTNTLNVDLSGGFLQGTWKHLFSNRSDTSFQMSYDAYNRDDALSESRKTLDMDFQHHFLWGGRQDILWGFEDRYSVSRSSGSFFVTENPANIDTNLFSLFVQDEIALVQDRLYLTIGTKVEHNYYTGWNAMPSLRLAWMITPRQTIWGAVSRALRTPDDTDESIRVNVQTLPSPAGPPVLLALLGNRQSQDEDLIAYEIGYRSEISHRMSVDLAMYFNNYTNLQTTEPGVPFIELSPAPPHVVVPLIFNNLMYGHTLGVEIAAHWKVTDRWTLSPGYAFEEIHMHLRPSSQDTGSVPGAEGSTPQSSAQLRSQVLIRHNLTWNTAAYFSGRLSDPLEASYTRLDTGLTWQFAERSSIGVVGQNLLRDHHTEFADGPGSVQTTLVKRSLFAQFIVRF